MAHLGSLRRNIFLALLLVPLWLVLAELVGAELVGQVAQRLTGVDMMPFMGVLVFDSLFVALLAICFLIVGLLSHGVVWAILRLTHGYGPEIVWRAIVIILTAPILWITYTGRIPDMLGVHLSRGEEWLLYAGTYLPWVIVSLVYGLGFRIPWPEDRDREAGQMKRLSKQLLSGSGIASVLAVTGVMICTPLVHKPELVTFGEPVTFILPAGYIGPVVVLYDQPTAGPPQREGLARLYRVPSSGIVRTQFAALQGGGPPTNYYVDQSGRRTAIPSGAPWRQKLPSDQIRVCWLPELLSGSTAHDQKTPYMALAVGRQQDCDTLGPRVERLLDSLEVVR